MEYGNVLDNYLYERHTSVTWSSLIYTNSRSQSQELMLLMGYGNDNLNYISKYLRLCDTVVLFSTRLFWG